MNKTELIEKIAKDLGETRRLVGTVIEKALLVIKENDKVTLNGFGTFEKKERASRVGYNFKTKEKMTYPARIVMTFKESEK